MKFSRVCNELSVESIDGTVVSLGSVGARRQQVTGADVYFEKYREKS